MEFFSLEFDDNCIDNPSDSTMKNPTILSLTILFPNLRPMNKISVTECD